MAFPTDLDDAADVGGGALPAATTALSDSVSGHPNHAEMHQNVGDAISAIEAKVGIGDSSAAADSVLAGTASGVSSWSTTPTLSSVTATTFTGDLTGDVTGGLTGDVTGNADTATALATARTIGGVSFDGTANINLPGVNTVGTQDTSGNAATATALETGRTISLTGDATGTSGSFDGSGNASIAVTVATVNGATVDTEWTDFNVTVTQNGSKTLSANNCQWRRTGEKYEVLINCTMGEAGAEGYTLALSGLPGSINATYGVVGSAMTNNAGGNTILAFPVRASATSVNLLFHGDTGTYDTAVVSGAPIRAHLLYQGA